VGRTAHMKREKDLNAHISLRERKWQLFKQTNCLYEGTAIITRTSSSGEEDKSYKVQFVGGRRKGYIFRVWFLERTLLPQSLLRKPVRSKN